MRYQNIIQSIVNSLRFYYKIDVEIRQTKSSKLFPEFRKVTHNGEVKYIIYFNPRIEILLYLYHFSMFKKTNIQDALNLYTLFYASLEVYDFESAKALLAYFSDTIVSLNLKQLLLKDKEETESFLGIQIYFILLHEAYHIIIRHSPASKDIIFKGTYSLLKDIKEEIEDQMSLISLEELLNHPKTIARLRALLPNSLKKEEKIEFFKFFKECMNDHTYFNGFIDHIIEGNDEMLVEEISCDRQAWFSLVDFF